MNTMKMDELIVQKMYADLTSKKPISISNNNKEDETIFELIGRQGAKKENNIIALFCRKFTWPKIKAFVKKFHNYNSYKFNFVVIDLAKNEIGYGPLESTDLPFWILKRSALFNIKAIRERQEIVGYLTDKGVQLCEPDQTPIKFVETHPPSNDFQYHDDGCILPRNIGLKFCEILQQ